MVWVGKGALVGGLGVGGGGGVVGLKFGGVVGEVRGGLDNDGGWDDEEDFGLVRGGGVIVPEGLGFGEACLLSAMIKNQHLDVGS